jgi:hypothetical protein
MSGPQGPNQHNRQHNHARGRGQVISYQGSGNQSVHLHNQAARTRTGVAVLVLLGVDVVFFLYGMTAYTGTAGNTADLWRAGVMLVLLAVTIRLIRRWFRQRL